MKKIVANKPEEKVISVSELNFDTVEERKQVIIYKRYAGFSYAMLCKVNSCRWGFVAIEDLGSKPNFEGSTISEAIKKVIAANRDIRIFKSINEFIAARSTNQF